MNMHTRAPGLIDLYQKTFARHRELPVFSDYEGKIYTYGDVAKLIKQIHHFFKKSGIQKGDKVALFGRNSSDWGVTFLAVISYGAVAVPVLPDFNPLDVHHIIRHSESKLLFAIDSLFEKLEMNEMLGLEGVVSLSSMSVLAGKSPDLALAWEHSAELAQQLSAQEFQLDELADDAVCVISYTSGTSGFTKGVMLTAKSLYSNIIFAREHMPLQVGHQIVSFLPMAHVFGLLFEFLFPVTLGCHITFLTKAPTPQVIVKAFREVKPHLILSVPLVIEKIYKKQILPAIDKPVMRFLMKVPGISTIIHKKVREKLVETFGGRFYEIVIGGAPLSREVELFFRKIRFPFTIGYGMTECGPLISYDAWNTTQPFSAGKLVDRMQVRIDSADPYREVGEILVKGDHVMSGYYKNEEATAQAIDEEGWLHTGDLGLIDRNNYIFIRGRSKNMLLGPSGQNIYPEEIEARLSNQSYVLECVVIGRDDKLVALVFPDREAMLAHHVSDDQLLRIMEENRLATNRDLPKYSQIARVELVDQEFEKTPKRNIKRYLYT
ncbi:AMP-binding protein [Gaoshiqia sp. Z1-71]|uniref:AMP-binding protein n=1 Tax=Gaoshiqia hydrogeniformans TaxID=3290090 RepID=UPI003BF82B76